MKLPRPVVRRLVFVLLVAAVAPSGCVTPPRPPPAPAAAAAEAFRTGLTNARSEGRREVEDIIGVYVNLPAEQGPGIAALRRDVTEALARLKRAGRDRLSTAEVDRLTVENPHFWDAWFEFDPRDSSLLMMHASLLMEAGELLRASMVLTIGVQTLPLNVQERMFWFTQQARTHWSVFRRLDELRELEKSWGDDRRRRESGLARAMAEWPSDGLTLEALLQSRAGLKPGTVTSEENAPISLTPAVRAHVATELAQLRRINPVAAARYSEDREAAAEFGRLWTRLADEDRPVEQREVMQFAEQARRLGFPEMALVAGRALAAQRGFMAPADMELVHQCLPQLLPAAEAERILARIEDGRLPGFQLTRPAEQPTEVLEGMDLLIHPLIADHAVREFARETLWINAAGDNAELRAEHLRARALGSSNAGRFAAALEDIDAALALQPKAGPWLIDRAVILSKMGRIAEADVAFEQVRKVTPQDDYLRSTFAVHCFGEGRFAEAEKLFRAARPGGGNFEYDVIFGYLAGLRRGVPDRAWLRQNRMATPGWPAAIQRYLVGEIDRAALLQAARDPFDMRTTEQQCEAYLSLGEVALAAGDKETAQREFENCVQSGIVGFIEYDLARRDLARLRPPPAPVSEPAPASAPDEKPVPAPAPGGKPSGTGSADDGDAA
jgi:lipoprotein NlpI